MYTVYALIDPRDNAVRYVGITDDVYKRFQQHINCSNGNFAKNVWITELRAINKMVIMQTLEDVSSREVAEEREVYWIRHYRMLHANLLNMSKVDALVPMPATLKKGKTNQGIYELSETETIQFIAAYKASRSIDKALGSIRKGTTYRNHARRIITAYALREEA